MSSAPLGTSPNGIDDLETDQSNDVHRFLAHGDTAQRHKQEYRPGDNMIYVALIAIATFLPITWLMTFAAKWSSFTFHPPFQSLALALFTFGILTLQPTAQPKTKAAGLARHQIFMLVTAFPVFLAGTWSAYYTKDAHNRPHFVSWHGTFGILTLFFALVQIIVGGCSVWFDGAAFGGGAKAKSIWKYHRLSGYILYTLLILTFYLGGSWSNFATGNSWYIFRFLAYDIGSIAILIAVGRRIRLSKMKFV